MQKHRSRCCAVLRSNLTISSKLTVATIMGNSAAVAREGVSPHDRVKGALVGSVLGDAFTMPVHWYYDTEVLDKEFGEVNAMLAPKPHQPGAMKAGGLDYAGTMDIMHDKAAMYKNASEEQKKVGIKDSAGNPIDLEAETPVHYHATLAQGQNTLTGCLGRLTARYLVRSGNVKYDPEEFLAEFEKYMLTPPPADAAKADPGQLVAHNDLFVDTYVRMYFAARSPPEGSPAPPLRAAPRERDYQGVNALDGVASTIPVIMAHITQPEAVLVAQAIEHAKLTTDSIAVFTGIAVLAPLLQQLVAGGDPDKVLRAAVAKIHLPKLNAGETLKAFFSGNHTKEEAWSLHHECSTKSALQEVFDGDEAEGVKPLISTPVREVVGTGSARLVSSCSCEHAMAAVLVLALQFKNNLAGALSANAMAGGHNTARGAVLGAIIGARVGAGGIPSGLIEGLAAPEQVQKEADALVEAAAR